MPTPLPSLRLVKPPLPVAVEEAAHNPGRVGFGVPRIDDALHGGLVRGGVHEFYAAATGQAGATTGLALALASRAAETHPLLWARQEVLDGEIGCLNGAGLASLGLDPSRVILARARNVEGVLRAGEQGGRCAALGAVLLESWGNPAKLDLTATRRLSLVAAKSQVPILMIRMGASPEPSAAATRWRVEAASSRPLEANAPGFPAFRLTLLRQRGGAAELSALLDWDPHHGCFRERAEPERAALPRAVVPLSRDRPAPSRAAPHGIARAG